MASNIIMPKLGMNMKEGTVVEWLHEENEEIKKGDPIAVISSDKIEKEIEAPEDGVLLKINAKENDVVPIGTVIGVVGAANEKTNALKEPVKVRNEVAKQMEHESKQPLERGTNRLGAAITASESTAKTKKRILISPSAKKLAESLGLDIEKIQGTGPNGRITNHDVVKAGQNQTAAMKTANSIDGFETEIKPFAGMRRTIADRLIGSLHNTAQLTVMMKADITELQNERRSINKQAEEDGKVIKLSVTDLMIKAATLALLEYPIMNTALINNELHYNKEVHIGVAVSVENGLIVPVVQNTEKMGIWELSEAVHALIKRARSNELDLNEIVGSTFSITNLGQSGVEYFTPVLNPPETGILGVGTSSSTVQFDSKGTICSREMLPLSLTFDHRVTDGKPASEFLARVKFYLENPEKIFS